MIRTKDHTLFITLSRSDEKRREISVVPAGVGVETVLSGPTIIRETFLAEAPPIREMLGVRSGPDS